jgi:DNA-directed RNA polymerase alpha subunit
MTDRDSLALEAAKIFLSKLTVDEIGPDNEILVAHLGMSIRSRNALKDAGIRTVAELRAVFDDDRIMRIRNIGVKCVDELKEVISSMDLSGKKSYQLELIAKSAYLFADAMVLESVKDR